MTTGSNLVKTLSFRTTQPYMAFLQPIGGLA